MAEHIAGKTVEQQEEEKLRAKFPNLQKKGPSNLLNKRLQKGRQFFDSGDYQMAKAKLRQGHPPPAPVLKSPESTVPKESPPAAAAATATATTKEPEPVSPPPVDEQEILDEATGHEHPTPEDVPHLLPGPMQRKASVHGQSKLTTSPTTQDPPSLSPGSTQQQPVS